MEYVEKMNVGGTEYGVGLRNFYVNEKGNLNIETSSDFNNTSKGKINIEAMDDIQLKPGDDIILYSSHRQNTDEVSVKVTDGDDVPVKLQLNTSEILLTTKDKVGTNKDVLDITVNSKKDTRGYLKVRAQAIDLRSESHGGIALQPKGYDSDNNMNKVKFEHGGGDGLEFFTMNTEKMSAFTDEYRFNKDGVVKMATRVVKDRTLDGKKDPNDKTTWLYYVKLSDDFYDKISSTDEQTTWRDIIKTANAFNKSVDNNVIFETGIIQNNLTITAGLTRVSENYTVSNDVKLLLNLIVTLNDTHFVQLLETTGYSVGHDGVTVSIINKTYGEHENQIQIPVIYIETPVENYYILKKDNIDTEYIKHTQGIYCIVDAEGLDRNIILNELLQIEAFTGIVSHSADKCDIAFNVDNKSVLVSDLIKLVQWMKANNAGPWSA